MVEARDLVFIVLAGGAAYLAYRTLRPRPPPEVTPPPEVAPPPPPPPPEVPPPEPVPPPPEVPPPPPPVPPPPPPELPPRPPPEEPIRPPEPVPPPPPPPEQVTPPPPESDWEKVLRRVEKYGGFIVIFDEEPPEQRRQLFMYALTNLMVKYRCVAGGGFRWYDEIKGYAEDVPFDPTLAVRPQPIIEQCVTWTRAAIEDAYGGYYREVLEFPVR